MTEVMGPGRPSVDDDTRDGQEQPEELVAPVVDDRPVVLDPAPADAPPAAAEDGEAAPGVHPRFTVRRGEVRRKLRRRRRRITLSFLGVVLAAVVAGAVLLSPLADVDHVEVVGASEVPEDAVLEAAGIPDGQAMFSVDAGAVRAALLELPWVERARVALRWPSTVEIKVVERPVLATVVHGEERFVVGRGGMVVERAGASLDLDLAEGAEPTGEEAPEGPPDGEATRDAWVPEVRLPDAVEPQVGELLPRDVARGVEMIAAIPSRLRPWVSGAEIDDAGEVSFVVGIITVVRLGTTDEAAEKLASVETMLSGAVVLDCMTELDVRVPNDPRVRRGGRC